MFRRVLFVDGVPPAVSRECITTPKIVTEFAAWNSLADERLLTPDYDLLVAVAAPGCRASANFFQSLPRRPISRPVLGIFPAGDENLRTASRMVDDFILAPVREDELRHRIHRILDHDIADGEERTAHARLSREIGLKGLVGEHPSFARTLEQIPLVARSVCSVVITGETGTGKELCARAIHHLSPRRHQPFIPVDCAAFPEHLFENEMFGHARGAFTDAHRDQKGLVALASGGTLFLDEIGEIPIDLQAKLLRVLQEGELERVGDDRTRKVNVRVVAATNRNLKAEAEAGRFRQDLYYRLSVFPVELPPLRKRIEDVPLLADHFLELSARKLGRPKPRLTLANVQQLQQYHWPGNVRELQHVIERAMITATGGRLAMELPAGENARPTPNAEVWGPVNVRTDAEMRELEAENIRAALEVAKGKVYGSGGAAELLGLKPTTLASRMKALGLAR